MGSRPAAFRTAVAFIGSAALGFYIGYSWKGQANHPVPAIPSRMAQKSVELGKAKMPPNGSEPAPRPWTWRHIESRDYKQYIQNLRRIGCPSETIKDIIICDVSKMYAPRFEELAAILRTAHVGTRGWPIYLQTEEKLASLKRERTQLLRELLGVDIYTDLRAIEGNYDFQSTRFDYLPVEKRYAMETLNKKYQDSEQTIYERTKGFHTGDDSLAVARLAEEKEKEIEKLLSVAEFGEYKKQTSPLHSLRLPPFEATAEEFQKIYEISNDPRIIALPAGDRQQAINDQIKEALGPERFDEFTKSKLDDYAEIAKLGLRFELSREKINELYALKQQADQAMLQFQNNTASLKVADIINNVAALRAQAAEKARAIMGPDAFDMYVKFGRNKSWLQGNPTGRP